MTHKDARRLLGWEARKLEGYKAGKALADSM